MNFRFRPGVLWSLLGLSLVALLASIGLVVFIPELLWVKSSIAPLYLLVLTCILGAVAARGFLRREWWICLVGGVMLGNCPLLLTLMGRLFESDLGQRAALFDYLFYEIGEPLLEPGMFVLWLTGSQLDIYSSHIGGIWLLTSWIVLTLLSAVIWTLVLALVLAIITALWRKILRFRWP